MNTTTGQFRDALKSATSAMIAFGQAVREAGPQGINEGVLYSAFMRVTDLRGFEKLVRAHENLGLVARRPGHVLVWTGDAP